MRVNIYSQELTSEVVTVEKKSNTGIVYHAAQLILHSSPMLHHPPHDDDRSAVTFWLPKSQRRREEMALAFERIAAVFRSAPVDTGLDGGPLGDPLPPPSAHERTIMDDLIERLHTDAAMNLELPTVTHLHKTGHLELEAAAELVRLRGEVGALRAAANKAKKQR